LSLEGEEALESEFLVQSAAKEELGEASVHRLQSVSGDGVVAMTHTDTAL